MQINPISSYNTNQTFKAKTQKAPESICTKEQADAISKYLEELKTKTNLKQIANDEIILPKNAIPYTSELAASIDKNNQKLLNEIDKLHTNIQKNFFSMHDKNPLVTILDIKNLDKISRNKYVLTKRPTPDSPAYKYLKTRYSELGDKEIQIVMENNAKLGPKIFPIYENIVLKLSESWNGRNLKSYRKQLSLDNAYPKDEFSNLELNSILQNLKKEFIEINSALEKKLNITTLDKIIEKIESSSVISKIKALLKNL